MNSLASAKMKCPYCGSTEITELSGLTRDEEALYLMCLCRRCGETFYLAYTLEGSVKEEDLDD